uniref:Uncharacterized protein n=1 Tax=Trichogramma kaykai TaxID=54128 RepID=A0ABD2WFX2_9HYME
MDRLRTRSKASVHLYMDRAQVFFPFCILIFAKKLGVFSSHLSRGSLSRYARHNLDVFHFKTQKNLPKESTLPASEVMRI